MGEPLAGVDRSAATSRNRRSGVVGRTPASSWPKGSASHALCARNRVDVPLRGCIFLKVAQYRTSRLAPLSARGRAWALITRTVARYRRRAAETKSCPHFTTTPRLDDEQNAQYFDFGRACLRLSRASIRQCN